MWLPTGSEDVVKVATSSITVTGVPVGLPSTWNWTIPVGMLEPCAGLTIAVNVTASPNRNGFVLDWTVVIVSTLGLPMKIVASGAVGIASVLPTLSVAM